MMNKTILRYFYFLLGLFINSFGIAFITKSALGTSQISSVPYVFSLYFTHISFGMMTFIFNMIFTIIQIIILKKDFQPIQFLQILANIIFSSFIDISMYLMSWFQPETLLIRIISLIIGCIILAFGISIEVAPNVIMVPGEGIVKAISDVTHKDFGMVKICFDITLIIIASLCSFFFFHSLQGVGLGTVVSALTVGKFVSLVNEYFPLIQHIQKLSIKKG